MLLRRKGSSCMRPEQAMNIEKPTYLEYMDQLSAVSGIKVSSFSDLCKALSNRMDFFASMGMLCF